MQTPESSLEAFGSPDLTIFNERKKAEARQFLQEMESFLTTKLPVRNEVRAEVDKEVALAKAAKNKEPEKKHTYISSPEGAFFKLFGIEWIHRFLTQKTKLADEEARAALLSESYRHRRKFSSNSPRSKEKYPFTKKAGENASDIAARWWSEDQKHSLQQSCPDLALRAPCPYRIVIEGKYFRKGGYEPAQSELVRDIYQCFYYRSLPSVPASGTYPEWKYDYACLLAYDASDEGKLSLAWKQLNKKVIDGLWRGANIHVMVIRSRD